jgi:integrase
VNLLNKQLRLFRDEGESPGHEKRAHATQIDGTALFNSWAMSQVPPFRRSTIKVYGALWHRFLDFQKTARLAWEDIDPARIKAFLASLQESKRPQRERYQALLERMFREISQMAAGLPDNPADKHYVAVPKGQDWRDAKDNDPTQFLAPLDHLILRERLIDISASLDNQKLRPPSQWRLSRDTAIVTLMFSCGIKPAEVLVLSVNCVVCNENGAFIDTSAYQGLTTQERGRTAVQDPHADATHAHFGGEYGAARQVPLPDWAHTILTQWLAIRSRAPTGARADLQRLFPGTRTITATNAPTVMNPATLARVVAKWGKTHASLTLTPQRLRNAYGSTLVQAGMSQDEIGQLMGYAQGSVSGFRLKQAWQKWCELNGLEEEGALPE